jgi:uncharacterized protein (TIGR04255 family)
MKKNTNLKYAPIQQALIAVHVDSPQPLAKLEKIPEILNKKYPLCNPHNSQSIFLNIAAPGDIKSHSVQGAQEGYVLFSPDRKKEVFVSTLNIAIRDAAKYKDGEHLINQYKEVWNAYSKYNTPEQLKRVGLRYINNFFMTPAEANINLLIKPVVNHKGKGTLLLSGLAGQYAVRSDFYRANANLGIVISPQPNDKLNITFDIDVFDQDIPYVDFGSIKDTLDRLREFKNKIFFDNILDAGKRFNRKAK